MEERAKEAGSEMLSSADDRLTGIRPEGENDARETARADHAVKAALVRASRSVRCTDNARGLRVNCLAAILKKSRMVILDLSKVEDADSSIVAIMVEAVRFARAHQKSLVVACSSRVRSLLELYRLDRIMSDAAVADPATMASMTESRDSPQVPGGAAV